MEKKNPVQSAERIFHILETVIQTGPIGLVELSQLLDLHKSTVHRLLTSLAYMGYIEQDSETSKYRASFKIVTLSNQILSNIDILPILHHHLLELANQAQETVHLVERVGAEVIYIDKVSSPLSQQSSIRMRSQIGLSRPMYCSAVGKSMLAQLPEEEVLKIWNKSDVIAKTEYTILSYDALTKELDHIRKVGYAIDNEENELGVKCIGIALLNHQNKPEYAFSISAPSIRMSDERIKELSTYVLDMKVKLSKKLGASI